MIGIDLGLRKITIVDIDTEMFLHLEFPKKERSEELSQMHQSLMVLKAEGFLEGPKWVESPVLAGARNIRTTIGIAQTSGAVHATLPDTHEVAVSSWKQRTVGKGNADKSAVREWLDEHHPELARLCTNQDLYDAACIALYGASVAEAMAAGGLTAL